MAYNQGQITEASHLLVFAGWDDYSLEKFNTVFKNTALKRGLPANTMDDYKNQIWNLYEPLDKQWRANHSARQAYSSLVLE